MEAASFRRAPLCAHINLARGIFTNQHDGKPGANATRNKIARRQRNLVQNLGRDGFAVYEICREICLRRFWRASHALILSDRNRPGVHLCFRRPAPRRQDGVRLSARTKTETRFVDALAGRRK